MTGGERSKILLVVGAIAGWLAFGFVTVRYLVLSIDQVDEQPELVHYDWHAYVAGAHDLADRTLYRVPLELGDRPLPIDAFNMPPLAAGEAALLLPLGITAGGVVWQVIGAACVALAAVTLPRLAGSSWRWALGWAGVMLGAYMLIDHVVLADAHSYWWGLALGTNNYFMLGLVAAFALSVAASRPRLAGTVLALAVATKLWPVVLGAVLVRTRSWTALAWAGGVLVLQGLVWLLWLGPDVVPLGLEALAQADPDRTGVIGISAARDAVDWLPGWTGWIVLAVLLAMPATGPLGAGLATLAGLAPITNLWGHYLPTVLFALGLLVVGAIRRRRAR